MNDITQYVYDIVFTNNRESHRYLKKVFGDREVLGVEVGVYRGANAFNLLRRFDNLRLILVDPYESYDEYPDLLRFSGKNRFSNAKSDAVDKLEVFKDRSEWIFLRSDEAIEKVKDKRFDFVYVDANHSYDYVLSDLKCWWPVIKEGGVLCGHDWAHVEVARAVLDFCDDKCLRVQVLNPRIGFPEWAITK